MRSEPKNWAGTCTRNELFNLFFSKTFNYIWWGCGVFEVFYFFKGRKRFFLNGLLNELILFRMMLAFFCRLSTGWVNWQASFMNGSQGSPNW